MTQISNCLKTGEQQTQGTYIRNMPKTMVEQ